MLFMTFQGMFAIIAPAILTGAFAERMKFSAYVLFMILWVTLVYAPVAHWVWAEGGWIIPISALWTSPEETSSTSHPELAPSPLHW